MCGKAGSNDHNFYNTQNCILDDCLPYITSRKNSNLQDSTKISTYKQNVHVSQSVLAACLSPTINDSRLLTVLHDWGSSRTRGTRTNLAHSRQLRHVTATAMTPDSIHNDIGCMVWWLVECAPPPPPSCACPLVMLRLVSCHAGKVLLPTLEAQKKHKKTLQARRGS